MIDFWHILLPIIAAIITAPLSAWLMSKLLHHKHELELSKLRADIDKMRSDVRSRELDNDKKAITMIMELVVDPLRGDMTTLQHNVKRLTNAINKIPFCPYADDCPVSRELQNSAADGSAAPAVAPRKRRTARANASQASDAGGGNTSPADVPTDGEQPTDADAH